MNDNLRTIEFEEILFAESILAVLLNQKLIIETPEYYKCSPRIFGFRQTYGRLGICLGNLIQLWGNGEFIRKCDDCEYDILVFYSYDVLNETNFWKGICPNCEQIKFGEVSRDEHYHSILKNTRQKYDHNYLFEDYGYIKGLELDELLRKLNRSKYQNLN